MPWQLKISMSRDMERKVKKQIQSRSVNRNSKKKIRGNEQRLPKEVETYKKRRTN